MRSRRGPRGRGSRPITEPQHRDERAWGFVRVWSVVRLRVSLRLPRQTYPKTASENPEKAHCGFVTYSVLYFVHATAGQHGTTVLLLGPLTSMSDAHQIPRSPDRDNTSAVTNANTEWLTRRRSSEMSCLSSHWHERECVVSPMRVSAVRLRDGVTDTVTVHIQWAVQHARPRRTHGMEHTRHASPHAGHTQAVFYPSRPPRSCILHHV